MKKALIKSVKKLKVPSKEKVLPPYLESQEKNSLTLCVYLKKSALAIACMALVGCLVLQGSGFLRNAATKNIQVVYGKETSMGVFSELDSDEIVCIGISDSLKKKMDEGKGQKVLFAVYIRFLPLHAYDEGFETSEKLSEQISKTQEKMQSLDKQLYELQKIYPYGKHLAGGLTLLKELTEAEKQEMYPGLDELSQGEKDTLKKQIDALCEELDLLIQEYQQLNEKENLERKEYCTAKLQGEIQAVKKIIGTKELVKFTEHSEMHINSEESIYRATIDAKTIEKIAERGSCNIFLALPERQGDYSEKITDSLTYYLDQIEEGDTIEIAAVSVYDTSLSYAFEQGLTTNILYNEKYIKSWKGFDINGDGDISTEEGNCEDAKEAYLNNILSKNGIFEKRIIVEKFKNFGFGFNAALTKEEIIALAEDDEIRAIYLVK